ncbi:MAG TPA: hypothetical protein PK020_18760, partial [Ilumatobacteraceae bacterium]|nr:hypothetical protein [Ilumatobacteraceae bacterium]
TTSRNEDDRLSTEAGQVQTATSGVTVRLYVNGDLVSSTTASGGTYATTVPLMDASNTIHATTFDTAESAPSPTRIVVFNGTRSAYLPVNWSITTATVLTRSQNHYYIADGAISIAAAGSLTIQPGVEVWFKPNAKIVATGRLWVRGKANNPVVLTGTNPDTGRWAGLEFRAANQLVENAVVERATTGVTFARVGSAQGSGTVRNSMIQDNITGVLIKPHNSSIAIGPGNWIRRNGDALRVEGAVDPNGQLVAATTYSPLINGNALLGTGMGIRVGQFHPAVSNLTINASGNWWDTTSNPTILSRIFDRTDVAPEYQMYYALVNHITALTGATVRPLFNGGYISPAIRTTREYGAGTYHLASPSYVMGGAAVTFEAGAQVLVDAPLSGGSAHAIEAQGGAISVNGTSAQPVTFKSGRVTPAAGDWAGIKVTRDPSTLAAGSMTMTYGDVRHAASGVHFDQTTGSVTQSIIRDNDIGVGVGIKGTPTLGVGNVITANRRGVEIIGDGANVANNPAPVITGASIYLNTQYNAYANTFANAATTTISARHVLGFIEQRCGRSQPVPPPGQSRHCADV